MARKQRRVLKTSKKERKSFNRLKNELIFNERKLFNSKIFNLLSFQDSKQNQPEDLDEKLEDSELIMSGLSPSYRYKIDLSEFSFLITGNKGRNYGKNKQELLRNAIKLGLKYHNDSLRKGRRFYYFVHPIQVARHISRLNLGFTTTVAGIIHDVPEDIYAQNPKRRISLGKIMDGIKSDLNPNRNNNITDYVNEISEIVTSVTKTPFEPWHKYVERLATKDSESFSKSISLKLTDLIYNSCDFPPLIAKSRLKPSYRLTFPGKNVLFENLLKSLEKNNKIDFDWRKPEINNLRKASLYFAHKVCLENLHFLQNSLSEMYVRKAKNYLKFYETKGGFENITRKSTDKEVENVPWKRFNGTMNLLFKHWKGEEKITSLEETPERLYDSFLGLKRVIELLYNKRDFYIK